jgi:methionine-rich copper-binding protein CopC
MRNPVLLALMLASLAAGGAQAHARLVEASPPQGAILAQAPGRLWLRFNEVVRVAGSGVQLTGPDGRARLLDPLTQDPKDARAVLAPLPAGLAPGRYLVRWRALSPDAHRTQGEFAFTIRP